MTDRQDARPRDGRIVHPGNGPAHQPPTLRQVLRKPLFRLLAINLAIGAGVAVLMLGGLIALDPYGLRHLIFADHNPGAAVGLLLFGFVVTFGSTAMGTAIMALGRIDGSHGGGRRIGAVAKAVIPARPR